MLLVACHFQFPDSGGGDATQVRASTKTMDTVKSTERLMEAIDNADADVQIGVAKVKEMYLLQYVNGISSSSIYEVLLALPFEPYSLVLLEMLAEVLKTFGSDYSENEKFSEEKLGESLKIDSGNEEVQSDDSEEESSTRGSSVVDSSPVKIDSGNVQSNVNTNRNRLPSPVKEASIRAALILIDVHKHRLASSVEHAPLLRRLQDRIRGYTRAQSSIVGSTNSALGFWREELQRKDHKKATFIGDGSELPSLEPPAKRARQG